MKKISPGGTGCLSRMQIRGNIFFGKKRTVGWVMLLFKPARSSQQGSMPDTGGPTSGDGFEDRAQGYPGGIRNVITLSSK